MKKLLSIFSILIFSLFLFSCDGGGKSGNGDNDTVVTDNTDDTVMDDTTDETTVEDDTIITDDTTDEAEDETPVVAEKFYFPNKIPETGFYYYIPTASPQKLYHFADGVLSIYQMTAIVQQDGYSDITINITPIEFYKIGDIYYYIFEIDGERYCYKQLYNDLTQVQESEMMRHPDIMYVHMDNGRFSITTNAWDIYTVSDIRNLTLSSGIVRTLKCSGYYLDAYNAMSSDYGLWFVCVDDGLSVNTNGLYYWPENYGSVLKIIDEPGEMWR